MDEEVCNTTAARSHGKGQDSTSRRRVMDADTQGTSAFLL